MAKTTELGRGERGGKPGIVESERCNDTDETVVIIRANDRPQTYLGQVSAGHE